MAEESARSGIPEPRYELVEIVADIAPEPNHALFVEGWAEWLTVTARELGRRLTGEVLAITQGDLFRVVRGRLYLRQVEDGLASVLLDVPDSARLGRGPRALRWLVRGAPRGLRLAIQTPRRARSLLAGAGEAFRTLDEHAAQLPVERLTELSDAQLFEYGCRMNGSQAWAEAWLETSVVNMYAAGGGELLLEHLREMLRDWAGDDLGQLRLRLLSGVGGIDSTDVAHGMVTLARMALATPSVANVLVGDEKDPLGALRDLPEAKPFLEAFARYLQTHGHRGVAEGSGTAQRWAENPRPVLAMLRSLARGQAHAVAAHKTPARGDLEAAVAEAHACIGRRHPLRRWLFDQLLAHVHALIRCRENSKLRIVAQTSRERRTALEAARRLHARGLLDDPEDCLHLTRSELAGALAGEASRDELARRIALRRAERERWRTEPVARELGFPAVHRNQKSAPAGGAAASDGSLPPDGLRGIGASPGVGLGPVRVVRDPSEVSEFPLGAVLVAPYTDTAWTPLFHVCAAVVVETGSVLAHAAIVARELGVPCIVQVPGATERLVDGERVEVDSRAGSVRREA